MICGIIYSQGGLMEEEMIYIAKKPGVKNCVRVSKEEDIPDFLKEAIKIENHELVLDCLEGIEHAPLDSVIAYEKLENGKMNVWNKANWKETLNEINGVFYELPKKNRAIRVTDTIPEEIVKELGDRLTILPNGDFQIDAGWGLVSCAPYNGYLVIYGRNKDGLLDVNFLTKGTPSFMNYYVVDGDDNIVEPLSEYDAKRQNTK